MVIFLQVTSSQNILRRNVPFSSTTLKLQLWKFETFLDLKLKGNVISFCDPYVHEIVCALLQVGQKQADARINLVNMQQWHTVVARGKRADRSTCNLHFLKPPPPNNFTPIFLCKYLPVPLLKSEIVHFSYSCLDTFKCDQQFFTPMRKKGKYI